MLTPSTHLDWLCLYLRIAVLINPSLFAGPVRRQAYGRRALVPEDPYRFRRDIFRSAIYLIDLYLHNKESLYFSPSRIAANAFYMGCREVLRKTCSHDGRSLIFATDTILNYKRVSFIYTVHRIVAFEGKKNLFLELASLVKKCSGWDWSELKILDGMDNIVLIKDCLPLDVIDPEVQASFDVDPDFFQPDYPNLPTFLHQTNVQFLCLIAFVYLMFSWFHCMRITILGCRVLLDNSFECSINNYQFHQCKSYFYPNIACHLQRARLRQRPIGH
jgi:hypothetical protein